MKKELTLPISLSRQRLDSHTWVCIQFRKKSSLQFCLGLCLLREELAKELVCLLPDRSSRFSVQIGVFDSLSQRAKLLELGDMSVKIAISSQELDYWLAFFLRYFRDGFAEVDHIDVEMDESEVAEKVMLTLKVDEAVSPVSEDEARKRLRL